MFSPVTAHKWWQLEARGLLAGPALANRRPCSNCASESTSSPLPFASLPAVSSLSFRLPFLSLPSPPRSGPLKISYGVWKGCNLPQRGPGQIPGRSRILLHRVLAKRIWLQHFWFFGQCCNELIYTEFLGSKMSVPCSAEHLQHASGRLYLSVDFEKKQ